jgi:hypothetical protein
MGQYNGDQIANNPTVVANYLRAAPTTRLATRQIQFFWVYSANASPSVDFTVQPEAPNSRFSQAVRGIQAQAEVVIIGSPNNHGFTIGVYADTFNAGSYTDPNHGAPFEYVNELSRTLQQSVNDSMGVTGMDVDASIIYGHEFVQINRAINYVNPQSIQIDGSYSYQGQSSYENELYTD